MEHYYYKDTPLGRIFYRGAIQRKDGGWILNPPKEVILETGWTPFEPHEPELYKGTEPVPEDISLNKLYAAHPDSAEMLRRLTTGLVYHYSTWEVLFKGILSAENVSNQCAILHAYSVNYMNDTTEGLLISKGLSSAEDKRIQGKESVIMTETGKEIRCPAIEHPFYKRRKEMEEYNAIHSKQKLFSVSFSKMADLLPMWNYYGHNGHGVSIGFDVEEIINQGFDLIECIYDKEIIEKVSDYIYDSCYWSQDQLPQSFPMSIVSKDSHFEYEQECRIPLSQFDRQYTLTKRNQFLPIKYDIKGGLIVPFVEIMLPISSIKEIWIGPTNQVQLAEDSLRGWLDSIGLDKVCVRKSTVPVQGSAE